MIQIRPERPADIPGIRAVNEAAFPAPAEAELIDALREQNAHILSLVAVEDERVAGHILFSPASIESETAKIDVTGLAPMSVLPECQSQGIGSQLVREGLAQCEALGHSIVIVLGHPDYYPRFGFKRADQVDITCEFPSSPEAFMIKELRPGALAGHAGVARYHPAFQSL